MAGTPTHWLRGNESEWSPGRVVVVDTETRAQGTEGRQTLELRLWVAAAVDRRKPRAASLATATGSGTTRAGLAEWVNGATIGHPTTWLYCHNLGFDLTVSRLPDQLHRLGWRMTGWTFAGRNVGGRMVKGSKRLTLCDSVSLLPHSLEQIGQALGDPKLPMPAPEASEEEWLAYCTRDVLVTAGAVLTLMEWWDREQLGHWAGSGPGCGWNALRHRSRGKVILVDTDPVGLAHDRTAVRGGRRDVVRTGEIKGGPFALVDFSNAYLTVAANMLTPKGRLVHRDSFTGDYQHLTDTGFGVLADCLVDTPVPAYPLRTDRGVFYPTGRFRTPLCSPEIAAAQRAGHLVDIGPGWVHNMGHPLRDFGWWCLGLLEAGNDQVPPVVKMMVKQWGRSVPSKFAGRQSSRRDLGPALWPGWHLERGTSGPDHIPAADVHIGGRHWWYTFDQESDNSYPAVLAWVESYVRVALNRMLEELGEDLWVCCDTDGCVLDLTKARSWLAARKWPFGRIRSPQRIAELVCEAVTHLTLPLVPRVKGLSETLTVTGPQHYAGDTFERAAGRPGKPEVDDDGHLRWWRWPKVSWQMAQGSPAGFVRVEGNWTAPAQLAHRWVLADGSTVPLRAGLDESGVSVLSKWPSMLEGLEETSLHPVQAPALRGLY